MCSRSLSKCLLAAAGSLLMMTSAFAGPRHHAPQRGHMPVTMHVQRMDGCPYYPSPVLCQSASAKTRVPSRG